MGGAVSTTKEPFLRNSIRAPSKKYSTRRTLMDELSHGMLIKKRWGNDPILHTVRYFRELVPLGNTRKYIEHVEMVPAEEPIIRYAFDSIIESTDWRYPNYRILSIGDIININGCTATVTLKIEDHIFECEWNDFMATEKENVRFLKEQNYVFQRSSSGMRGSTSSRRSRYTEN